MYKLHKINNDHYIINTNEYIAQSESQISFDAICEDILAL